MPPMVQTDHISPTTKPSRGPKRLVIALLIIGIVVLIAVGALFAYVADYYHDTDTAGNNLVSTAQLPVEQGPNYLAFGNPSAQTGIVFYPGAKVEYSAYAPLMRDLAERGYFAVVVQMPLNFAFFGIDAANDVRAAYPQVNQWWVGGHSLGGSMAAQYAANHADDPALGGVILLASYSASDLSATNLGAIVMYGSKDQVLNREKLQENEALLPEDALTVEIIGGNHAGFGDYGAQDGDGDASITPDDQRAQTVDAIDDYLIAYREGSLDTTASSIPQAA